MPSWLADAFKVLGGFVAGVATVPLKVVIERWLKRREMRLALYSDLGRQYHIMSGVHDRLRTTKEGGKLPWNPPGVFGGVGFCSDHFANDCQRWETVQLHV
jgi:hypothetical protein